LDQLWVIYVLVFIAALLGVQASYWLVIGARRTQKAVNRRLALTQQLSNPATVLETLRRERGLADLNNPLLGNLSTYLMQTGLRFDGKLFFLWTACAILFFVIFGFAFGFGAIAFGITLLATAVSVVLFLRLARNKRIARFAEQLPDSIDIIVRGVRVGHPFSATLGLVAREMPDPIGTEFGMAFDEISFGLDVRAAIENLYTRVGQEDLLFLIVSINVQSQTGGNLAEILARLSRLIRQRATMRLKIRAISAEGRISALFLTLMPFILFGIVSLLSPEYFGSVRNHPIILPAAFLGLTMLLIGNVLIYRMVNFKY
jgi:tight adherence protein B